MTASGYQLIQSAALQAMDAVRAGMPIKGILVREDIYAEALRGNPEFNGATLGMLDEHGLVEFFIMPLSVEDAARLGFDQGFGPFGTVLTEQARERIEQALRSF